VTLLFTDLAGSTALKQRLGDRQAVTLIQRHHALVRELLLPFQDAREISTAGDSFFLTFGRPSDAVRFGLLLQHRLRTLEEAQEPRLADRVGIHLGEVVIEEDRAPTKPLDYYGIHVDTCARVMSVAEGGQILLTRSAFDNARAALRGADLPGLGSLSWANHGGYLLKGIDEPVEICEVRAGAAVLTPPATSEKARRHAAADLEPVLGWRPAPDQVVPNTQWLLEGKLGEGGFGEVWRARHQRLGEQRVFKFCFRADRARSLRREVTLFKLLKERVGQHPNIVGIQDVYFEEPPYYIVMDSVAGADLRTWCNQQGGIAKLSLETRLDLVAQAADGLAAAHEAGVIHRDIKPSNLLVAARPRGIEVKLTDFGIGQVTSETALAGLTKAGFTQTLVARTSSSQSGTQLYMAPELLAGKPATTRSDIYSLGVVLYQLLVGDFARPVTTDWAQDIGDPLLREDLQHCFAGHPEERFLSVAVLARQLRALPERQAALARERAEQTARERAAYRRGMARMAGGAVAIALALALLAALAWTQAVRAKRHARTAVAEAARAEAQRQAAEATSASLRRYGYAVDMNAAHHALAEGNLGRAAELVRRQVPQRGEEDLRGFEWRYLWEQARGDARLDLARHATAATVVAFAPDGEGLVTGSFDGSLRLWSVGRGVEKAPSHQFPTAVARGAVEFSPDGELCVVARPDGVLLIDSRTWQLKKRLASTPAGYGDSMSLAISRDSRLLAVRAFGGVELWDLANNMRLGVVGQQHDQRAHVAFSRVDHTVAVSNGSRIELWDARTPARTGTLEGRGGDLAGLAWSASGEFLAAAWADGHVSVWDLRGASPARTFRAHAVFGFAVAFSPDSGMLATGGADQVVCLWDTAQFAATRAAGEDVAPVRTLRGHGDQVWAVAFSPDGRRLASASKDGEVKVWPLETAPIEDGFVDVWNPVGFLDEGRTLLAQSTNGALQVLDLAQRKASKVEHLPVSVGTPSACLTRGNKRVAIPRPEGTVELWDLVASERPLVTVATGNTYFGSAFSPGGDLLAVVSGGAVVVWELPSGRERHRSAGSFHYASFSPDGRSLALVNSSSLTVGDSRPVVTVWDSATFAKRLSLAGHTINITMVEFSPSSALLASAGHDNTVRVWDAASGRERFVLRGHLTGVNAAAFSPDERTLATAGTDGAVRLWHLATGQEMVARTFGPNLISRLLFSPSGDLLVVGFRREARLRLWRVKSPAEIETAMQVPSSKP
jgi:WD40 repeat protein/class 3 adenylate cyclase/tRNA A-37 threonylcarbamoyl transferase component Bud32